MLSYFSSCSGLIIDIRNNGGGSLGYADRLASRFVSERMLAGYIYHKVGAGHDDFSARYPVYIEPSAGVHWDGRVCILTNRHSYSASNDFVSKMCQLPLVTIIGDRTGGGGGLPVNAELPNGWTVRYSSSPLLNALGEHIESGIDPDIWSSMLSADVSQNLDTIIECAIALLTSNPQ
jgi:C-terminal processing protease CtpA/Prc